MHHTIGSIGRAWLVCLAVAACGGAADDAEMDGDLTASGVTSEPAAATSDPPCGTGTTGASASDGSSSGVDGDDGATDTTTSTGTTGVDSTSQGTDTGEPGETAEPGDTGTSTTGEESTSGTEGTGDTEGSSGTTGEGESEGALSFMEAAWPILSDRCSCHKDSNGAGKLKLTKSSAYDNLVGEPSDQLPEMLLVDPGSSATSYLWHKLDGTHKDVGGEGKIMPPGGQLDVEELDVIRDWIDQGAAP